MLPYPIYTYINLPSFPFLITLTLTLTLTLPSSCLSKQSPFSTPYSAKMVSPDNDLIPPKSLHPHAIAEWFHDSENVGGFVFLCFATTILLIATVSLIFAIYYFFVHPPLDPVPGPKSIWISIADYQDKLTPEQQLQYIEQACKQYEDEMEQLRLEQQSKESGVMFPKPTHKHATFFSRIKHYFHPRYVCPLEEIHRDVSECYFVDDYESIEQVEKEANDACFPHNMV